MRTRSVQVKFFLSSKEIDFVKLKMKEAGIKNRSAYLRKMALDGYIICLDFSELKDFSAELSRIGNNLNQIAKVANTYGEVSMPEVRELTIEINKIFGKIGKVVEFWMYGKD